MFCFYKHTRIHLIIRYFFCVRVLVTTNPVKTQRTGNTLFFDAKLRHREKVKKFVAKSKQLRRKKEKTTRREKMENGAEKSPPRKQLSWIT